MIHEWFSNCIMFKTIMQYQLHSRLLWIAQGAHIDVKIQQNQVFFTKSFGIRFGAIWSDKKYKQQKCDKELSMP
jgi:hypothetical protein